MIDLESKRKKYDKLIKVVVTLLIGLVFGPIAIMAVGGLVGLVFAWVVSETVICLTPWMSMKFANWRVAAIKHEAAKNPIETMENEYAAKVEMLQRMKESIKTFFGTVKTFHGKLDGFKREFPGDAKQFDDQYAAMMQLLDLRKLKYEDAKNNLVKFESVIRRAKAIWQMAQEAAKMRNAAGVDVEEFYSKLKVETALDSVTQSMNSAFADLELALMDEKDGRPAIAVVAAQNVTAAIPAQTGPPTLDLNFEEAEEPQLAARFNEAAEETIIGKPNRRKTA